MVEKYYNENGELGVLISPGFGALVEEIDRTIAWQEHGRREYECSVGDAFETDCEKLEKWDCYGQAKPNMEIIAREVIRAYKQHRKEEKRNRK